ncbi:MAG: efflux RND transporter periplasmic adaptor subunit [Pseudomonadales bacterium]|nr:efflux RND transporter periplasmic adaptor subunit [Pseudomonadales bacterium]
MPRQPKITLLISAIVAACTLMFYLGYYFAVPNTKQAMPDKPQPIYWVAPMDANYTRDQPGKSPMGMDLVPVYANSDDTANDPGAIRISPEVINNLGVRTASAAYQHLETEILTVGYVQYDADKRLYIHPRVAGWVEKLYVKTAGEPVTKDQALYEIYSPTLVNAQEELLLALERKNKRLIKAATDRLSALQVPTTAIQQLTQSRKISQNITVYAPQEGIIDNLNIGEGFFVKPDTMLMSIAKLDEVWVEAEVFARQASLITQGLAVTMWLDYSPTKTWPGTIDYVYPALNLSTRTVRVRLRFNNQEKLLKPHMFAQVAIHTQTSKKPLTIPLEAIIRSAADERVVLALGEGRFKSIEISIGRYGDKFAEVLSGLQTGDRVVTSAQFLLDSESSKSSDFKRFHYPPGETDNGGITHD